MQLGDFRDFHLEALTGAVALTPDSFQIDNPKSCFLLRSPNARCPSGLVRIGFRIAKLKVPIEVTLRIETETRPVAHVSLQQSRAGSFAGFIFLPPDVVTLHLMVATNATRIAVKRFGVRGASYIGFVLAQITRPWRLRPALKSVFKQGLRVALTDMFDAPQRETMRPYIDWRRRHLTLSDDDVAAIYRHIKRFAQQPIISIVMLVPATALAPLRRSIASVTGQLYPHWELCIVCDASLDRRTTAYLVKSAQSEPRIKILGPMDFGDIGAAYSKALEGVAGPFFGVLSTGDELSSLALYMIANEIDAGGDPDLIYSDEDKVDHSGNVFGPVFKPDWSRSWALSQTDDNHLTIYRTSTARRLGGFNPGLQSLTAFDLMLRISERTAHSQIRHIPHILYHRHVRGMPVVLPTRQVIADHLARSGIAAQIADAGTAAPRILYPLPNPLPLVSLLVPTRDGLSLLKSCISGLLDRTDYANIEIIILDNDSREPDTLAYFASLDGNPRVRVARCPGAFNFAAINNRGVSLARGPIVGLINSDIEVIDADWLTEMVRHAIRPNVGAVGAKLLYPDGTVQHAGVVLGMFGVAGHVSRNAFDSDAGYCNRARSPQSVSAVTGACMVMRKDCYFQVGGMDDEQLKVAFNDIDLCLKLRQAGYDIVWTPYARLYHHESASRGSDATAENIERFYGEIGVMQERWPDVLRRDPFYNPNLTLASEDFALAEPPRAARPWRS